jgi:MFS family permease
VTESKTNRVMYLLVLPFGHFAVDLPGSALWLLAPVIGIAWGLSPAEVGLIITAHAIGGAVGFLPAGLLSDRFRLRGILLLIALWWVTTGYLAASTAANYWVLLGLLGFAAIGDAAWHPPALGTMVAHMPQRRALVMGVHQIGGIAAEVVAPLFVGYMLAVFEWQTLLRISVLPASVIGVGFIYFKHHVRSPSETTITRADVRFMFDVWLSPSGLRMLAMTGIYSLSLVALLAMVPLFFLNHHGYSTAWVGTVFAAMLLVGGFIAPILGSLSDRTGRKWPAVASMLMGAALTFMVALAANPVLLVAGVVLAGGLLMGVRPVLLAAALEMVGRRESTSLGLIYTAMDGVGALGGLLAGIAGGSDLRYALVFAAGTAALSGVIAAVHPFAARTVSLETMKNKVS